MVVNHRGRGSLLLYISYILLKKQSLICMHACMHVRVATTFGTWYLTKQMFIRYIPFQFVLSSSQ